MLTRKATNTNYRDFGLTGLNPSTALIAGTLSRPPPPPPPPFPHDMVDDDVMIYSVKYTC